MSTIRGICIHTCEALWKVLSPINLKLPTRQEWTQIADGFYYKWHFPNCIGALDGKHVKLISPPNSGTLFFNHKCDFSTVLLALVDADYKFRIVDIGEYGSNSDSGIFRHSKFGKRFMENRIDLPEDRPLPNHIGVKAPFVIVADAAFPSLINLLRPFPGANRYALPPDRNHFNERLSRARRIVENAFGIMQSRFRVYQRTLNVSPEVTMSIVKATVVLHNYLVRPTDIALYNLSEDPEDDLPDDVPGLRDLPNLRGNQVADVAKRVRQFFADYFMTPQGRLPWQ